MSDEQRKNDDETHEIERTRAEAESEIEHQPGLPSLVSEIKTIEQQVGEHVITALRHENTVAVLTAVLPTSGGAGQRIASVPLDQELWMNVQELLMHAGEERANDVQCVGFQCVLEHRRLEAEREKQQPPPDNF